MHQAIEWEEDFVTSSFSDTDYKMIQSYNCLMLDCLNFVLFDSMVIQVLKKKFGLV